jgi:ABC-type transport system involved in cytochrome c biogenesis permease component
MANNLSIPTIERSKVADNSLTPRWLEWIDGVCERIGDAINPILVKEARQALKSRQFIVTFSILLLAALAWTIIGSLSMMPQIYTSPSAPRMLTGYYFVLAVPMLLVVPMAAYRSLESEIEDGTLELLSISALGPWQIVLGKLASAMLQMALYFVALFPCVAYAYNLRGVDLPTTLLILGILLVSALILTIGSLFMAAISSSRSGRITSLFVIAATLLVAQWWLGLVVIDLITNGNPLSSDELVFALAATVAISVSVGTLLLTAAAAQLTPESENRSTKIRLAMLQIGGVLVGVELLAILTLGRNAIDWIVIFSLGVSLLWAVVGSMMAAESPIQTPRIRRELPQSLFARSTLTWLTPGPATGLIFAIVNIALLTTVTCGCIQIARTRLALNTGGPSNWQWFFATYAAYLTGFLVLVRGIVALIRTKSHPRAEIGLVTLIASAMLFAAVPYAIELHQNDYREFSYSLTQITNWAWTLQETIEGNLSTSAIMILATLAGIGFLGSLVSSAHLTLPRRIATPDRVLKEKQEVRAGV